MGLRRTRSGILGAALLVDARRARNLAPAHGDVIGPVCDLCNEIVDEEEIVEGEPGGLGPDPTGVMVDSPAQSPLCKVRVKHHGAEEVHTFDFETVWWSAEDLKRRMQHRRWFSPLEDMGEVAGSNFSAVPR